ISFLTAVILVVFGIRDAYPLFSFSIVAFMVMAHLLDIYRGVRARRKMAGEAYLIAFIRLFARNRRRYGGYIVHIGIAMIAMGIIGSNQFDVEKTATLQRGETLSLG